MIGRALAALALLAALPALGWEPARPVELVVPAGPGGGADQMARLIQSIVAKHNLMRQPIQVVNEGGGGGAEAFLDVKAARGDAHKILLTLSNIFTTPLATGVPFSWRDLTPVRMMALDEFVLWVNAATPYRSAKEYLDAVRSAGARKFTMGGTGSKQEDQILTAAIERQAGVHFTYVPFKGGGEVAMQLAGRHVDSTVSNPIEGAALWRAGNLRPLCVFDAQRMPYREKMSRDLSWNDIPTCREAGIDAQYLMLRGIFLPGDATPEQVDYYAGVLEKVTQTKEWKRFVEEGALNAMSLKGREYADWMERNDRLHHDLMKEAGFLAK